MVVECECAALALSADRLARGWVRHGRAVAGADCGGEGLVGRALAPPTHIAGGHLQAVSCSSSRACVAVGYDYSGIAELPLIEGREPFIERWDGHEWSVQRPPENVGRDAALNAVSCTSTSTCTAVGYQTECISLKSGCFDNPMVLRWNGVRWRVALRGYGREGDFSGVSCASARVCMAVEGARKPMAWNGRR